MIAFAGVVFGFALLIVGGGLLVRGATEVAARYGVPPLIVGLTIVGFGTSMPELVVNLVSAAKGATDLAFGNVVGSNISNLGLVLGAAALLTPITVQGQIVRREVPLLLLATTVMTIMALDVTLSGMPAIISRSEAIVLLLLFLVFVYISALDLIVAQKDDRLMMDIERNPIVNTRPESRLRWIFVLAGVGLLFAGGEVAVRNSIVLADSLGISTTVVGLFVVAIGTSMPELVTSIIAAVRGESDLALGNVVGSNIFNSLIVLPATGLVVQIPVPRGGVGDLVVSWSLAALLIPIFFFGKARMGRKTGSFLLLVYFTYLIGRTLYDSP